MLSFIFFVFSLFNIEAGMASVYNDAILACPYSSYGKYNLPTAAHRFLPCGTIINIKRLDNGRVAKGIIADRGPYGMCIAHDKDSRACGKNGKWINGAKYLKRSLAMPESAFWRGILDMSPELAKKLGTNNRLVPVIINVEHGNF